MTSTDDAATDAESTAVETDDTIGVLDTGAEETIDAPVTPRLGRFSGLMVPLVLAVLLVGSAGFAASLYLTQFRADQGTDVAVRSDTVTAASDGTVALLSYAPDTMDKDFAAAKSHLTGDFLDYYSRFTQDVVTPAVQQKAVKTSASIVQSAVSELTRDSAVVLVFLNQTTTSKDNPAGSFTASSVKVGLTKVNGAWLISSFDPI